MQQLNMNKNVHCIFSLNSPWSLNLKIYPQRQTSSNEATCPLTRPQPLILSTQCTNLEPDNQIYEKAGGGGAFSFKLMPAIPVGRESEIQDHAGIHETLSLKLKTKTECPLKKYTPPSWKWSEVT